MTTLYHARTKAGLTQEQAARLLSVTLRTYQRWEAGRADEAKTEWAIRKLMEASNGN
jgi:transcriptional regulator with XRE-family HTH domain